MNRSDLYTAVQRRADTEGTKINAAEVSRVCALLLDELNKQVQQLINEDITDEGLVDVILVLLEEPKS